MLCNITTQSRSALALRLSSSLEWSCLSHKARETVERLHDWMHKKIVELLEPYLTAHFKYRVRVEKYGYLTVNYQLSDVDRNIRKKVDEIVTATCCASRGCYDWRNAGDSILEAEWLTTRRDRCYRELPLARNSFKWNSNGGLQNVTSV